MLNKVHRLPTPHFFPTNRRFGRDEIIDPDAAAQERDNMSHKEFVLQPQIEALKKGRASHRAQKREQITAALQQLVPGLEAAELESAVDFLVSVRVFLSGGRSTEESYKFALREYKLDTNIDKTAGRITTEEAEAKISAKVALAEKLQTAVAFNPEFNLIKYSTPEEIAAQRQENVAAMKAIYDAGPITTESRRQILELIKSDCFPFGYRVDLKRKYLKTIKPQYEVTEKHTKKEMLDLEKKKKGSIVRKWDYAAERVELVYVPKTA